MKVSKVRSTMFFLPYLLCFLTFWATPFVYGVYLSFRKYTLTKGDAGFVGLDNFIRIFETGSTYNHLFFLGLKNTILFVVISVIPLVVIGLGLALLVYFLPERLRPVFRTIFFISYAVSVTTVAAIFKWLFEGNGGYINSFAIRYGLLSKPILWLETLPYAWISITIATVWWTIGFNMMLFINALNEIDSSIIEASSLDGAKGLKLLRYIILPNIKNVFFFVLMTSVIASFNLFGQSYLMTKGNPGQSTQSLIQVIQGVVLDKNNLSMGIVMSLLMGIIIMAFSITQFFLTREQKLVKEVQR